MRHIHMRYVSAMSPAVAETASLQAVSYQILPQVTFYDLVHIQSYPSVTMDSKYDSRALFVWAGVVKVCFAGVTLLFLMKKTGGNRLWE